jgi:hypothetical protein
MNANTEKRAKGMRQIVAAAVLFGTLMGVPVATMAGQSEDDSRRDRKERRFDDENRNDRDRNDRRRFDFKFEDRDFDLRIRDARFQDRGRPVIFIRGEGFSRQTRVTIFGDEVRGVRFVNRNFLIVDLSRFDRRAFERREIEVTVFDRNRRDRSVVKF